MEILNNIGGIFDSWGNYEEALKYFIESSRIFELLGLDEYTSLFNDLTKKIKEKITPKA